MSKERNKLYNTNRFWNTDTDFGKRCENAGRNEKLIKKKTFKKR